MARIDSVRKDIWEKYTSYSKSLSLQLYLVNIYVRKPAELRIEMSLKNYLYTNIVSVRVAILVALVW
jgi:hypothetical protein